jgi:hypothetical protein
MKRKIIQPKNENGNENENENEKAKMKRRNLTSRDCNAATILIHLDTDTSNTAITPDQNFAAGPAIIQTVPHLARYKTDRNHYDRRMTDRAFFLNNLFGMFRTLAATLANSHEFLFMDVPAAADLWQPYLNDIAQGKILIDYAVRSPNHLCCSTKSQSCYSPSW